MSDYSFMKSGFSNGYDDIDKNLEYDENELLENISVLVLNFMENALTTASKYVKHSNRKVITKEDIRRCFMIEVFFMNKREDTLENCIRIKEILSKIDTEEDEEEEEEYEYEYEEEEFTLSLCKCSLCEYVNVIDKKWEKFEPKTRIEQILHKHIDNM